jgi:taurine---2-oxoglutarate transaminase
MSRTGVIQALHKKHVLSPWIAQGGPPAPVIDRGEGVYLYDTDGNRYLDLASGLVASNLGHAHPKVVRAMQEQAGRLCFAAPSLFHDARAELAAELSNISPFGEEARVFFTTAGAEANDDAVRLARALTGRPKILAAYRSFHGASGGSIHLTGEDRRFGGENGGSPGDIVRFFAPYPYRSPFFTTDPDEECARAIEHLERVVLHEDPRRIAAVLIEPVVGSNGVIVYPSSYLQRLRALTHAHGILLVFDEVMTGFGRVGAPFAAQRLDVQPDLVTFAKGVTSAYVPLGGVMMRESLAKTFDDRALPCGHTYAGHAFAVATGLATMRAYVEEGLLERGKIIESWLGPALRGLADKHPVVGDARGPGAFYALELVRDKASREPIVPWHGGAPGVMKDLFAALRARGVLTFGKYNLVMVAPPLTITRDELDEGLSALDAALETLSAGSR